MASGSLGKTWKKQDASQVLVMLSQGSFPRHLASFFVGPRPENRLRGHDNIVMTYIRPLFINREIFKSYKHQVGSLTISFGLKDPTISWAPKNPADQILLKNALSAGYGSHSHWPLLGREPLIPSEIRKPVSTATSPYQLHLPSVVSVYRQTPSTTMPTPPLPSYAPGKVND